MVKLSILDQTPVPIGQTGEEALKASLELAQLADALGYHRYWLSEHHNSRGLASASPEVLAAYLASHTSRIRVGSGGVLLSHYSSYKVAETFRLLSTLFPNRMDLGIGRAPGGDPRTRLALTEGQAAKPKEAFPLQIHDLLSYLSNQDPTDKRLAGLRALPVPQMRPEIWLLGSSTSSANYAAEFGTPFSFAHFINPVHGPEVVRDYRSTFRPSWYQQTPYVSVCVFVVCAETDEEAVREAKSLEYWLVKTASQDADGIPSVEEAEAFLPIDWQLQEMRENRRKMIVGSPETVREGLEYMAADYQADEIMIVTNVYDQSVRRHSYELIADAFELNKDQALLQSLIF